MELIKALETLKAPADIRFNILAFDNWKNSADRKIKLARTVEWLNSQLKIHNANLQIELNSLKFSKMAITEATKHLDAVGKNLPFDQKGRLQREDVIDLCTHAYAAGYSAALAKVEEPETAKIREESVAVEIVQQKVQKMQEYINAKRLVSAGGNILDW